jgi:hypothetical protein
MINMGVRAVSAVGRTSQPPSVIEEDDVFRYRDDVTVFRA